MHKFQVLTLCFVLSVVLYHRKPKRMLFYLTVPHNTVEMCPDIAAQFKLLKSRPLIYHSTEILNLPYSGMNRKQECNLLANTMRLHSKLDLNLICNQSSYSNHWLRIELIRWLIAIYSVVNSVGCFHSP